MPPAPSSPAPRAPLRVIEVIAILALLGILTAIVLPFLTGRTSPAPLRSDGPAAAPAR